jgi:hypothetical protein
MTNLEGMMENIVFERDYEEDHHKADEDSTTSAIFDIATDGGFIAAFADAMQVIPKVVVPSDKENYEYLLKRSDELAQCWGGKVRGVVNYEKWEATIDLLLPYAEFCDRDDLNLLKEFADKSHSITFQASDGGKLRIHIFILYFEEIADKDEIFESILQTRPDIVALLEQYRNENPSLLLKSDDKVDNLDDSEQVELITWFVETWVAATGESKESVASAVLYEMQRDYKNALRKILDLKHKLEEEVE